MKKLIFPLLLVLCLTLSACGVSGGLLGIACMALAVPDFPATDPVTALAVGIVSGFAATGVNQAAKQLSK